MFTKKELDVLVSLIDGYQFDGAEWSLNDVHLNTLKKKIKKCQKFSTSPDGVKK